MGITKLKAYKLANYRCILLHTLAYDAKKL